MSDTDHGTNGKRWYDPHRVTLVLFGVVFTACLAWGTFVFAKATGAADKNIEQDEKIKATERWLERIESKLDKVLERK